MSVGHKWQQADRPCPLDGGRKFLLVLGARTGNAAGKNLSALADELSQLAGFLIIDIVDIVCAEYANLFSLAKSVCALNARGFLFIHDNYPILS